MRVLVIAPHMDDEVLGVGGTISRHVAEKDEVSVCFVAHRVYNHRYDPEKNRNEMKSAQAAHEVLGYKDAVFLNLHDERLDACLQDIIIPLEAYVAKVNPDIVYIPHRGDNNQDHRAVFQAAMVALRPAANKDIKKVLSYEVPSSTEQAPPFPEYSFIPNYYVNIESSLDIKLQAMGCYGTEKRAYPHPRSEKALFITAQRRGIEIGFSAAEAFILIREKWD
nr:PIG-L deacetylase family protein [uncultured Methanoregula sp.]